MSAQWTTTYTGLVSLLQTYVEDASTEFVAAVPGIINRAEERCLRDLELSIFNERSALPGPRAAPRSTSRPLLLSSSRSTTRPPRASSNAARGTTSSSMAARAPRSTSMRATTRLRSRRRPTPPTRCSCATCCGRRRSAHQTRRTGSPNGPDLLLAAALVESESFLIAPERKAEFEAAYAGHLRSLRGIFRDDKDESYEPMAPTPTAERTH